MSVGANHQKLLSKSTGKKRKCCGCGLQRVTVGATAIHAWCSDQCLHDFSHRAAQKAQQARIRSQQKAQQQEKKQIRVRRKVLNETSLKWQVKQTQASFNRLIRLLDAGKPCISCGKTVCGTEWHCGHYKSVAARPQLRFDPRNAYLQGSSCNKGSAKFTHNDATVSQQFEANLIRLYGRDLVDFLNGPHPAKHYTCEDLTELRRIFNAECKVLGEGGKPTKDWRAL